VLKFLLIILNIKGKDRYYRKYWIFTSCPGVFVEDNEDSEQLDLLLEGHLNQKYKLPSHTETECNGSDEKKLLMLNGDSGHHQENHNHKSDNESQNGSQNGTTNGKENKPQLSDLTNLSKQQVNGQNGLPKLPETNGALVETKMDCESTVDTPEFTTDYVRNEFKWTFFSSMEEIDKLINSLSERGIRESELKQNLKDLKDKIAETMKLKTPMSKLLVYRKYVIG